MKTPIAITAIEPVSRIGAAGGDVELLVVDGSRAWLLCRSTVEMRDVADVVVAVVEVDGAEVGIAEVNAADVGSGVLSNPNDTGVPLTVKLKEFDPRTSPTLYHPEVEYI
ncbi:uncharacterized protein PAC_19785 [Phialocephala subalpina]|uniref:Uncharacterized protein n=1 Tax=Phialocephala subalpina TaxID=576137 RepID=A0A1L7XY76_9HELO|nr:uncharacterized protein PAC_19785 [Phialocephala subalpina]